MDVDEPGRIPPVEDFQAPRHGCFATVELLVKTVPDTTYRLRQHNSGRNRINEGRQRNAVTPTADPCADHAEGHGPPDSQAPIPDSQRRAQTGAVWAPVCLPIRGQVIEAAADQPERHDP